MLFRSFMAEQGPFIRRYGCRSSRFGITLLAVTLSHFSTLPLSVFSAPTWHFATSEYTGPI